MTTAKDLFIIALHLGSPDRPVGQGDLSLALAGAELVDLVTAGAVSLDGDRIVPDRGPTADDRLLAEAAAALEGQTPYERVEDWLWRRGRDLADSYQAALEEDGELRPGRRGLFPSGADRVEPADTPSRRQALDRWEVEEPVLVALASAAGVPGSRPEDAPGSGDEAVTTVLLAVGDAVMELEAVRQRRAIENAAFANVWRGP
ncbi:GPP34 family phosphoprotein [Streptomyces sp. NPDC053741]|uniref:GPP34 family phosphoprotein n=1 Tax=[Kitasatospora] papulosa TaxID=1464011 RepID=A0ABZ1JVH5_9ACTN|nr:MULTISPECIES: GPP34 family phosphoprotein [Streptomyces]TPM93190.1 GPP34 family phosphoprotein [Mesorhizobium sp. B2-3-3]MDX3183215.1 GPP34 family phosphoprotein [Streptomyces sp. ME02-7008A-1]MDX3303667.1 GPP34 family phosphoprotein [Streptomyces sp. ME02-7008A]MEE1780887.1 GPP34 family phosphoprotein [Streptomyces sp. JV181]QBR04735.1 GPP34 family phosphoprotein [Streptomyces sp. S501]